MAKYKFILLCAILLCTITSYAQPAQYTPMTAAGYQMKRLKVDSTLHLPSFCGVPTLRGSQAKDGALAIDTCNALLYMWTNQFGWDTVNTSGGGEGNQDLQSVLNTGSTSINKDISIYGKSTANQVYISGMDNNFMPFFALGDSIGGGIYEYTYPQATIEFVNKNMSQKLKGQDSTRSIIYLPIQTNDATDTLAKLSDVRSVIGGGDFWNTSGTTNLSGQVLIKNSNGVTRFQGEEEDMATFSVIANDVDFTAVSGDLKFINIESLTDTSTYKPLMISSGGVVKQSTSWVSGGSSIDTTNQFVKRLTRTPGKDSIIYFVGGNRFAIKDSVGTNPPASGYYGAFQDNTSQTAASINTAYAVKLNTTDLTNGVSVVNDGSSNPTRITLANTGIYNIQFSLQLEKTGGSGNMIADIWIRKNGVDIPSTTGKVVLTGSANASPVVAAWNYVLDLAAGDYIQLMWATSNTNVEIVANVATSPHPAIPSAILTVTQQAGILAGTGITAINSLTGAAQTMTTGTDSSDFKIVSTGTTHKFNLPTASATKRGALSSSDWTTFNNKIGISDTSVFLRKNDSSVYYTKYRSDTSRTNIYTAINGKLNISDTANMLSSYSNRINGKLNISDTANMLSSYSTRINGKLNISDANQTISAFQYLGSSIKFFPIGVNSFIQATTNLQFVNTRIFLTAIYVPTTTTVTGVKWITGSAGTLYVGDANYNGIALYSYNVGTGLCTRIDSTASDPNIWTTTGFRTKAFVTPTSLTQGVYYLAAICNGSATAFPSITQTAALSSVTTYDFTSPAKLTGSSGGTVSPASFNLSTITSTSNTPVIALY